MKNNKSSSTTGKLVVSLDFELGWGSIENGYWRRRENAGVYDRLRTILPEFLNFLDEREAGLSWATVGAMVTKKDLLDLEHVPSDLKGRYQDFLQTAHESTYDGRDLYDLVLNAKSDQYICSHTYSHVRFSYPGYSDEAITRDLLLSRAAKSDAPNPIDALVFPLNHDTTYKPLADANYTLGRGKPNYKAGPKLKQLGKVIDQLVLPPPMVLEQTDDIGVMHHSGSMFYNWPGRHPELRKRYVNNAAYRGLNKAVKTGGTFHIWFHPYNLSEISGLLDGLQEFLDTACNFRDAGKLEIQPMQKQLS